MRGSVFTWTRTWHPFAGTEGIGVPFVTVIVALDEAPIRLTGLLDGPDEGMAIGLPLDGAIGETPIAEDRIPSIRWRIRRPEGA